MCVYIYICIYMYTHRCLYINIHVYGGAVQKHIIFILPVCIGIYLNTNAYLCLVIL